MKKQPISWDDFKKVDIRTGTIITANEFEKARKAAYKLEVDFGPLGIKKSSAQITDLYTSESLIGLQILAVVNFPPKQIANFFSECLVLGVVNTDGAVTLLTTERKTDNGLQIS